MLLSFTSNYYRIQYGQKKQTIRKNWQRWLDWYENRKENGEDALLQIYWGNPRNKGQKMGDGVLQHLEIREVQYIDDTDAQLDGFLNRRHLMLALKRMYPELQEGNFMAILTFEWIDGPHEADVTINWRYCCNCLAQTDHIGSICQQCSLVNDDVKVL